MSKIDRLNVRVSKLLSKAVQEVLEMFRETVHEYQEKTARTLRENQSLRRRLRELQDKMDTDSNGMELRLTKQEMRDGGETSPSNLCEAPDAVQLLTMFSISSNDKPELDLPDEGMNSSGNLELEPRIAALTTVSSRGHSRPDSRPPFVIDGIKAEPEVEDEAAQASGCFYETALFLEPPISSTALSGSEVILNQQDGAGRHDGSRPQTEKHCGKSFGGGNRKTLAGSGDLRTFQRRVGKQYSCSMCGRTFTHAGDYKKHSRVHTGEKPYSCSVCGKRFSQSGYLKVHLRYHTGEKPFACPHCGKSFSRSNVFKKHIQTHRL